MKILHTNFHKGWGGQSNRILIVCRELRRKGHDVTLAAPPGSELLNRARSLGVPTFDSVRFARGFRPVEIARDVIRIRNLVKSSSFDIIHTHGSQDSWTSALSLVNLHPRPLLLRTKHNVFPIRDHLFNRWLYGRAMNTIVCISHAILDYCREKPYLWGKKLALIHSAVNLEKYSEGRGQSVRREFGVENRFLAGITGRLRPEKGHVILFQALARIHKDAPDLRLLVIGTGSDYQKLADYAGELGIAGKVIFTGFRKDVADVLAALDLFIMPSLSEGLGTAALEAGAAGLPIIASNVGGIPDILENEVSGLLTPPGNPDRLAEAILRLLNDGETARKLGNEAKKRVSKDFSESALAEKTENLYRELLRRP